MYSGFATRKMEDLYISLMHKSLTMLSAKILHTQQGGSVLTNKMQEQVSDEKLWSMKLLKRYRVLRKLEKRKYHGGYFAQNIRTVASYFSGKHLLGPEIADETLSNYSGRDESKMSASPRADSSNIPTHNVRRPQMEDFSPSPDRQYSNQKHLSVNATSTAGKDKEVNTEEQKQRRTRTTAKLVQPFTSQNRPSGAAASPYDRSNNAVTDRSVNSASKSKSIDGGSMTKYNTLQESFMPVPRKVLNEKVQARIRGDNLGNGYFRKMPPQ